MVGGGKTYPVKQPIGRKRLSFILFNSKTREEFQFEKTKNGEINFHKKATYFYLKGLAITIIHELFNQIIYYTATTNHVWHFKL